MSLIETLINHIAPHKKRKKRKKDISSLFAKEVVEMKKYDEQGAKEKALELLELILSVHHDTKLADCETDTKMMESIKRLLTDMEAEESDLLKTQINLYRAYAKELHEEIHYFIEINKSSYIDFEDIPEILEHVDAVMENKLSKLDDYRSVIQEMNGELENLRKLRIKLNKQGRNRFLRYLFGVYTLVIGAFGTGALFGGAGMSGLIPYFLLVLLGAYATFEKIYKRWIIVGYSTIFGEYGYYEE